MIVAALLHTMICVGMQSQRQPSAHSAELSAAIFDEVSAESAINIHQPLSEKSVKFSKSEVPEPLCMAAAALALAQRSPDIRPSAPPFEMSYKDTNIRLGAFSGVPAIACVQSHVEAVPEHVEHHRRRERCCSCDCGVWGEVCIFGCPCCIPCVFCLAWCNDCCCHCG